MKFLVYGHDECPYCDEAKATLTRLGYKFEYFNTRKSDLAKGDVLAICKAKNIDPPTVPQIWVDDGVGENPRHIGGCKELKIMLGVE